MLANKSPAEAAAGAGDAAAGVVAAALAEVAG